MQALFDNKLSYLLVLSFPILLICSFALQRMVQSLRKEVGMAKYIMERGPIEEIPKAPDPKDVLPGYTILTKQDYDEVLKKILKK